MTEEKRFTLDDEENGLCRCILVDGEEMPTCEICDLLNKQDKEIQALKNIIRKVEEETGLKVQQIISLHLLPIWQIPINPVNDAKIGRIKILVDDCLKIEDKWDIGYYIGINEIKKVIDE